MNQERIAALLRKLNSNEPLSRIDRAAIISLIVSLSRISIQLLNERIPDDQKPIRSGAQVNQPGALD